MKRIHYAGGSLLTGDDIADALVRLAEALALNNRAAEIHAPALTDRHTVTDVTLLMGPASQMLAEAEPYDGDELEDRSFVEEMEARVRELAPQRAGFVQNGTDGLDDVDIDML
jgi:hypothetical protein